MSAPEIQPRPTEDGPHAAGDAAGVGDGTDDRGGGPLRAQARPASPLIWLLVLASVGYGIWLRLTGLGDMPLYGDEYHGARVTSRLARTIFFTYDSYGTHVALPLLQRFSSWLTSPGIVPFRAPAVIAGVLTLAVLFPVGRRLVGAPAAALATLALALSPVHVYYSRFGRAYSITILLGLLLLALLVRAEARGWRGKRLVASVVALAALTPWVHLSSAGFVAGLGLAAIGLGWARGGFRSALRPLLVFAGAAVLCLVLFLPVFEQVIDYVTKLPPARKSRPESPLGIMTLLAGGAWAGVVWLVAVPVAVVLFWRGARPRAALLAAGILGPVAFLLATRPHGMEYAYARYLLNGVPLMLLLLGWLMVRCLGSGLGVGVGAALSIAVYLLGPQSPLAPPPGAFANTYLAMRALPAFDKPFPPRVSTDVYEKIAADEAAHTIIEAPVLHSRAVLLYRNYYLTHGKRVLVGLVDNEDIRLNGPYAFLGDPLLGRRSGAQYLVVHKDVTTELMAYWAFVYNRALPKVESSWNRGFMERHKTYFLREQVNLAGVLVDGLRAQLGAPFHEDAVVVAWKLKGQRRKKPKE